MNAPKVVYDTENHTVSTDIHIFLERRAVFPVPPEPRLSLRAAQPGPSATRLGWRLVTAAEVIWPSGTEAEHIAASQVYLAAKRPNMPWLASYEPELGLRHNGANGASRNRVPDLLDVFVQNYRLFSFLAGVRLRDYGSTARPLAPKRGAPADLSPELAERLPRELSRPELAGSEHDLTWIGLNEFYGKLPELARIDQPVADLVMDLVVHDIRHALSGAGFAQLADAEPPGSLRFVMWFDS